MQAPLVNIVLLSKENGQEYDCDIERSAVCYKVVSGDEFTVKVEIERPKKDKFTTYVVECLVDGTTLGYQFQISPEHMHVAIFDGLKANHKDGRKRQSLKFANLDVVGNLYSCNTEFGKIIVNVFEGGDKVPAERPSSKTKRFVPGNNKVNEKSGKFFDTQRLHATAGSSFTTTESITNEYAIERKHLLTSTSVIYDDKEYVNMRKRARIH